VGHPGGRADGAQHRDRPDQDPWQRTEPSSQEPPAGETRAPELRAVEIPGVKTTRATTTRTNTGSDEAEDEFPPDGKAW
jgi:hypothetical protein